MKLVKVVWQDAFTDMTKHVFSIGDITHEPVIMESIGWELKRDKAGITIAQDRMNGEEFTYRNVGFVPQSMILDVVTLYERKKNKGG